MCNLNNHNRQRVVLYRDTLCLTEQKEKRDTLHMMQDMAAFPAGFCHYELAYDQKTDSILAVKSIKKQPGHIYFLSRDEAYACLLTVGEAKIRKHYFGI